MNILNAKSYVGPLGARDADVIIVGEQPGQVEVVRRLPFQGPAGTLLMNLLKPVGIPLSRVYFTNVIKDLDNSLEHYVRWDRKTRGVVWSEAGAKYVQALRKELEDIPASIIFTLGNVPLAALTQRWGVTNWRGSLLDSILIPGKRVVPTVHPAFVVRGNSEYKHLMIMDMRKGMQWREDGFPKSEVVCITKPSFNDCMEYLSRCLTLGMAFQHVSFDIEIKNEELNCFSLSLSPTEAISIPLMNANGNHWSLEQEVAIIKKLAQILESSTIRKIGQNIIFDSHFMLRKYGIRTRNFDDTMVAQHNIMFQYKKGLDMICSLFTSLPYYKDEGKEWFKKGGAYETLWHYNALDSIVCSEAFPKQIKEVQLLQNEEAYDRQRMSIEPCTYMMERGIRVDLDSFRNAAKYLEAEINPLREKFAALTGGMNPNSSKQLKEYFYREKGYRPYKSKTTGNVTVDSMALKRLQNLGSQEASILLQIRKKEKILSTYLQESKIDADGRLRCQYNPCGTSFSRLSSSASIFGTGMNMQNWPHAELAHLKPDLGYIYYAFDLSQAENRLVAYVGNVTSMIEAFETGKDLHRMTASLIFGKPYEEISAEAGSCQLAGGLHSERDMGKRANHGLNYDLGYKTFALYYEMPERDAKFIHTGYHTAYPGVQKGFHQYVKDCLGRDRTLTNLMGRRSRFLSDLNDETYKMAYSCIPQGTVGDVINERALCYMYYDQQQFKPVELLIQVHDSVGFQIPITSSWMEHARMLDACKKSLETPLKAHNGHTFVIPADLSMGLSLCKDQGVEIKGTKWPDSLEALADTLKQNYFKLLESDHEQAEYYRLANQVHAVHG